MGAVVGECLRAGGVRVVWGSTGRSAATHRRAKTAGLEDLDTLAAVVAASEVVLSVCPPGSAVDVARLVAAERFQGLYVDANAVAPDTARRVGEIVTAAGAVLVDGGIIGPPPRQDRKHAPLPLRAACRRGGGPLQGHRARGHRAAGRHRGRLGPQDGVRRMDEGLERAPDRRARARRSTPA
jgi:hypothetical protein